MLVPHTAADAAYYTAPGMHACPPVRDLGHAADYFRTQPWPVTSMSKCNSNAQPPPQVPTLEFDLELIGPAEVVSAIDRAVCYLGNAWKVMAA